MPPQVLAIVVLPTETSLLDSDLAGRPAGTYLLDRLATCEDVVVRVAAGAGADTRADSYPHILVVDGRAWLSQAALRQILITARESDAGFTVSGVGGATLAVYLSSAGWWGIEQLFETARTASVSTVDAGALDTAEPALLLDSYAALTTAERHVLFRRAMDAQSCGVRVRDPHHVYLRGDLECGAHVELDIGVIIQGKVVLGDRVRIGAHSIVTDSQIGDDSSIHPFSIVERSTIGRGTFVGPYGRVRPGSTIGDRVQIGNYVEIKSADIGDGSRINHHSFIGDALIADRVTIGAGTITCNHDGTGTNQTVIETGAYIGSGCNLVAPVRIGERATVGAGSTITRDVPPATLTLARSPQTTINNWQGPKKK